RAKPFMFLRPIDGARSDRVLQWRWASPEVSSFGPDVCQPLLAALLPSIDVAIVRRGSATPLGRTRLNAPKIAAAFSLIVLSPVRAEFMLPPVTVTYSSTSGGGFPLDGISFGYSFSGGSPLPGYENLLAMASNIMALTDVRCSGTSSKLRRVTSHSE